MAVRVILVGQGLVATHFAVGIERIKRGELEPYGVPLAKYQLVYDIKDIELVGSYDVDEEKVGKTVYEVAKKAVGDILPVPETLKSITVRRGIHLGSLRGLPFKAKGLEDELGSVRAAIEALVEEWKKLQPDVVMIVATTEPAKPFHKVEDLVKAVERDDRDRLSASHAYAYAAYLYAKDTGRSVALVNVIPSPLARDDAIVKLYEEAKSIVLGDDGATGATPLTADLLEHLAERNRYVHSIAQFNIGGNTDFLALTIPERNKMKEETKSSIVKDILGYDAPHFIKPTGYLEPLGDKKFVSMHIWWKTFNGLEDELVVNMRINDSPALAGLLVDLARIGKTLTERGIYGTAYEVNAFYMKDPGPRGSKNMSRIRAYYALIDYLKKTGIIRA
ncbi:inositol-3-phosphate synthase [Hyperthermus butylicus]|uniref:Myo-inositol-1-phosphate synthase n=1 Tax=Hyperthermus butylicus (strain DSM 5456 / JCM 9403 / PLM1-5) TaxID=415426 RepID=A2BK47_HYPBU|nr:inositol-3-phosphate synthase [Hyperthermus butylicus]ABM80358.1 Myo-inositol-1-phosphate synthase [Hyperthermus butylicus DSM 5456]